MNKKKNKTFDCVSFKHKAQSHIYKDIAPLSARDQAAYFESLATHGRLGRWWKSVRRKRRPPRLGERNGAGPLRQDIEAQAGKLNSKAVRF
ncbi:MAG: hypothetical protein ACP5I8_12550 [Phycisphaerae bacterium]